MQDRFSFEIPGLSRRALAILTLLGVFPLPLVLVLWWLQKGNALLLFIAAALVVFILWLRSRLLRPQVIIFRDETIGMPWPRRSYSWDEASNVVLKDGLLSIDLNNNRILQLELPATDATDEAAFNTYCRGQLSKKTSI